jgi:DNA-binding NarL/FixJ family response regulator
MSTSTPKRVVLCDDHEIVREAIKARMAAIEGVEIVGEAETGEEVVDVVKELEPDVCIVDVELPGKDGIDATKDILKVRPETRVIIFTAHAQPDLLTLALRAGASGYVLKREADHDLVDAIRAVLRGEPFLTNSAQRSLVREWMADASSGPSEPLTPREQEVLKLIAEAHTNREIGEILHLSEKTVESHRGNLLRKLGMRDRVELVRYAIRRGLIEP